MEIDPLTGMPIVSNNPLGNIDLSSRNVIDSSKYFKNGLGANMVNSGANTIESPVFKTGSNTSTDTTTTTEPGMFDWLKSDNMKGISTIGGLGLGAFNIWNSMNAQEQAKKQWSAENARADKILGMNTERYEQWKADKNRLNSQYA